jgi:exonuclease III
MVDEHRLGVLAIQETHFDNTGADEFQAVYKHWFKLIHSTHPIKPKSTAGVAFLLNKKFIDVDHVETFEMAPGRALMISVPWHKGRNTQHS